MSWKPCEDFMMVFSDETGEPRAEDDMDYFVKKLREVAGEHGFDISQWGGSKDMKRSFALQLSRDALGEVMMKTWKDQDDEEEQERLEEIINEGYDNLRNEN